MRGGKVQINWHDRQPVLTVDFHRVSRRLATGGGDHVIKIWEIASDGLGKKPLSVSHLSSLFGHRSAVNVVRFSPCGNYLASGADGGGITLWKLHITDDGESWKVHRLLVSHCNDVLDLQWSSDGAFLVSASADNTCVIWNHTCAVEQILQGHSHHVQGVAWDPLGQYKATLSSDRTCKIFANKPQGKSTNVEKINFLCQHTLVKAEDQNDSKPRVKTHLFHDETLPSAYRRLAWSPDGSFVVMPAGLGKYSSEVINTAYVMSRRDLSRPEIQLLGAKKAVVAIRFCSVSFSLHESESDNLFKVPHRAVFAVATLDSLYVYDTETFSPLQTLTGLHRGAITDIAWSSDAKYLALSSQDGYCTFFEFKNEELGQPHILPGIKEPAKMTRHQSIPFSAKKIQIVETKDLGKRGKFSMSKPANIDPQLSTEVFLDLDHNPDHIYRLEVMKKCSHRNVLRLEGIIAIGPEKSIGVLVEPYSGLLWTYISKNMDLADLLNVVPSVDLQNIIRQVVEGFAELNSKDFHHGNFSLKSTCYKMVDGHYVVKLANFIKKALLAQNEAQLEDWRTLGVQLEAISKLANSNNAICNSALIVDLANTLKGIPNM